ncbi:hypothetical protein TWF694_005742 [Orbilia ellipsospora]|uniref:Uncharacterized protein n=1 Tax=Orbilia ellipsospora TaxID=2528407 RepID=A0AAV9WRT0_9PEZI
MPSVLDEYVQDYRPLKQYPPIIPNNPQRASGPAPFCRRSLRENADLSNLERNDGYNGCFARLQISDNELMPEALDFVPKAIDEFLENWSQKCGKEDAPCWLGWYHDMIADFHGNEYEKYDHPSCWRFSELAAALDPKFDSLRCTKFVWVKPPEMKMMVEDLMKFRK